SFTYCLRVPARLARHRWEKSMKLPCLGKSRGRALRAHAIRSISDGEAKLEAREAACLWRMTTPVAVIELHRALPLVAVDDAALPRGPQRPRAHVERNGHLEHPAGRAPVSERTGLPRRSRIRHQAGRPGGEDHRDENAPAHGLLPCAWWWTTQPQRCCCSLSAEPSVAAGAAPGQPTVEAVLSERSESVKIQSRPVEEPRGIPFFHRSWRRSCAHGCGSESSRFSSFGLPSLPTSRSPTTRFPSPL